MNDDDFMEIGSGLIPQGDGWYLDINTGNKIDSNGNVYDSLGELIHSAGDLEEAYPDEEFPHG